MSNILNVQPIRSAALALATLVALLALVLASGATSARAAEPVPSDTVTTETLTPAVAKALAATSSTITTTTSGIAPDRSDIQGFTIGDAQDTTSFVSYGLGTVDGQRSFIGQYFDAHGNAGQTVEFVYVSVEQVHVWVDGVSVDPTLAALSDESDAASTQAAGIDRTPCWWLYKYAQGQVAFGALVAAVGGVTALFTGPVGAAIAAAGGLGAAQGGINVWVVSLFCPASEA